MFFFFFYVYVWYMLFYHPEFKSLLSELWIAFRINYKAEGGLFFYIS